MATGSAQWQHSQSHDKSRMHNGHNYNYTTNNTGFYSVPKKPPGDPVHADLIQACAEGQRTPRIRTLLGQGANIDHRDGIECTPLHHAVFGGSMEIISYIIETAGADINAVSTWFGTPLCLAVIRGDLAVVEFLIEYKADVNRTCGNLGSAAHAACMRGNLAIVRALHAARARWSVKRNTCATAFNVLGQMADRNEPITAYYTRSNIFDCQIQSPGAMAVNSRHYTVVDFCLGLPEGLSANETWCGMTLLGLAMSTLDYKTGEILLIHGANACALDASGRGALIYALQRVICQSTSPHPEWEDCVRLLSSYGIDFNGPHKRVDKLAGGSAAGYLAIVFPTYSTAGLLIRSLATLLPHTSDLDEGHETALMYAIRNASDLSTCMRCINVLCGRGARVAIRGYHGETAMNIAHKVFQGEELAEVICKLSQYAEIESRRIPVGSHGARRAVWIQRKQ